MITIDLNTNLYNKFYKQIKKQYIELNCMKNILFYIIDNYSINSKEYQFYFNTYIDILEIYTTIKQSFQDFLYQHFNDIKNFNWEIIFEKDLLIVYD